MRRKLKGSKGDLLLKRIRLVTFLPDGKRLAHTFIAEAGRGINEDGIERILQNHANELEKKYQRNPDFRMVPVTNGQYNFVPVEQIA